LPRARHDVLSPDSQSVPLNSLGVDANLRSRIGWIAVVVLFVAAATLFYVDYQRYNSGAGATYGRATIGAIAPDVPFDTLDGHKLALTSYGGHPLVVNFFATWCVPCKAELPLIESRYVRLAPRGLAVLGADEQESVDRVRAFVRAHGVTYPVVIDQGPALEAYGGDAIPTSLFVDRKGVLRAVHIGEMTPEILDQELQKIL
jgi:cytochrome c biogenesis protein CcmG/thiol:disulfide interchange protein DsbE